MPGSGSRRNGQAKFRPKSGIWKANNFQKYFALLSPPTYFQHHAHNSCPNPNNRLKINVLCTIVKSCLNLPGLSGNKTNPMTLITLLLGFVLFSWLTQFYVVFWRTGRDLVFLTISLFEVAVFWNSRHAMQEFVACPTEPWRSRRHSALRPANQVWVNQRDQLKRRAVLHASQMHKHWRYIAI